MVVKAFYINEALGEIMGSKAYIVACNATVGSPIDDRHVTSVRLGVSIDGLALVAVVMFHCVREVCGESESGVNLEFLESGYCRVFAVNPFGVTISPSPNASVWFRYVLWPNGIDTVTWIWRERACTHVWASVPSLWSQTLVHAVKGLGGAGRRLLNR